MDLTSTSDQEEVKVPGHSLMINAQNYPLSHVSMDMVDCNSSVSILSKEWSRRLMPAIREPPCGLLLTRKSYYIQYLSAIEWN